MDRFTRGERLTLAVALVVAVAAGVFAWTNFTRAFPEAHLSFTVNRATSEPVAEKFLAEHAPAAAAALAGRSHAAIFRADDGAKVYLERELGLERLGELTREGQVHLWSWAHRWYRPLTKEEVRVEVTPEGQVMGFAHPIPEEAAGASLDEAPARTLAERFLASAFKLDPATLAFIESKREDRPHRRDWTFTWERAGWRAKDATYRIQVAVHGDEPAGYAEYLKIPDAWTQGYQKLRAANDTTAMVAAFGIVLTLLAALIVLVREGRRGNVRWRLAMLLTAVAFGLFVLMSLNQLPVASYGFDTTGTYGAFLAGEVLQAIAGAGVQALVIFLVVAAGEPLFRAYFPRHLRVTALFERSGWRSKRMVFGLVLGYCLAVVFLAYQVAFYLIGQKFGAWNPADVPFDNLLNTSFPWLAVLFIGFYPAVSEEFMSRVFSIPLVGQLTRSRVASVVIPALIWGFAHANYPAQPFYIRGVEVSIAGLFVGIVLYRFGVVPCLVWHYVVDAGYTSMLLVRSGNPYFVVTALAGVGALLFPLGVTLAAAWRRGGFVADPGLLNDAEPAPPEPPAPAPRRPEAIAAPPLRRLLPAALALTAVGLLVVVRAPDPGRGIGVKRRPEAVRQAAEAFVRARGEDPSKWRFVVTANSDILGAEARRYLLEHGGVAEVARFAREVPLWRVRAVRPMEREGWEFGVDDASDTVVRFDHTLREEAPGATVPVEQARRLAEAALTSAGLDPATLEFKEAKAEKRPARTDHTFTWKDPARSVAGAEYLIDVTVHGDTVDAISRRLKLPEAWERARGKATIASYARLGVMVGIVALLVVQGLLAFYRGVRQGEVSWRTVLAAAALPAGVFVAATAVMSPLAWAQYPPSTPEALFRVSMLIGLAIGALFFATLAVLVLGALSVCFPGARATAIPAARRPVAAATAAAAAAAVGAALVLRGALAWARAAWPTAFSDAPVGVPAAVASAFPALGGLGGPAVRAMLLLGVVGLAIHVWRGLATRWLRALFAAGLLLALLPVGPGATGAEIAAGFAQAAAVLAGGALLVRFVLGANPAAYALAAGWLAVLGAAAPLLAQPGGFYALQGLGLVAAAAAVSVWWLLRRPRSAAG
ncbi:MAG: type II CAAX endopeptidase family protein, partial [Thermoanaerobaculaceae bacterium]|nr:type II CAAX endopeptidase family protein [Thermoanaerobaculaceae bacterium]